MVLFQASQLLAALLLASISRGTQSCFNVDSTASGIINEHGLHECVAESRRIFRRSSRELLLMNAKTLVENTKDIRGVVEAMSQHQNAVATIVQLLLLAPTVLKTRIYLM